MEYRLRRADGEYRWVLDNGAPRYTPEGEFAGYIGSCMDITQRRQAELEAARQRNELAHLSRVTLLGELSGSLAHELNQPLGAIVTNAGAALRFLARDTMSREKFREILEDIVAEGRRAGCTTWPATCGNGAVTGIGWIATLRLRVKTFVATRVDQLRVMIQAIRTLPSA